MQKHFSKTLASASLALLLLGCEVGPDYQKPDMPMPDAWKSGEGSAQAAIEQEWWKNFNDPVLSQLIGKALEGNYDLKIAEARIAQSRAARASAFATLLPSGNIKGSATREANQLAFPGNIPGLTNPFDIFQAGFDASWEMDLFGGNKRAEESAADDLQASEASYADARVSLLAEVARTYIDIRRYQAQLAIANDTVDSDRKTVSLTRQRADTGNAPYVDVTQAEAELQKAEGQIPYYMNLLTQAEFSLDVLLGVQPGAAHAIVGPTAPIPSPTKQLMLATPAAAMANRPDIRVAERKLASATAQQGVALAKFFPDISITGFFGLLNVDAGKLLQSASKSWMMGGTVLWPILDYGHLSANMDNADAQQQEALATYQKTVISALADVEKSVTAYTQQIQYSAAQAKSAESDRKAQAVAMQRYSAGMTSFLETLDADRTLYTAQSKVADARADEAQNLVAVYKSLGGGWQTKAEKQ